MADLKFLYVNANHSERAQVELLLLAEERGADIVCITEPYARNKKLRVDGWNVLISGRAAVLLRKSIDGLELPSTVPDTVLVALPDLTICVCYASPNARLADTLEPLLPELRAVRGRLLVVGDFNCRTSIIPGVQTDRRGSLFEDFSRLLD